jgi:hypothetical protein
MALTDMSPKDNGVVQEYGEDPISIAYSIADLFTILLAYENISENNMEREVARRKIWGLVNKWLETVSPLKYIPGLVDEVHGMIKYRIWDVSQYVNDSLIEELITYTVLFKQKALSNEEPEVLEALSEALANRIKSLMHILGAEIPVNSISWKIIHGKTSDPADKILDLVTLVATVFVLATNI